MRFFYEVSNIAFNDLMIVRWASPYKNPRDESKTVYFVESQNCGYGQEGYTNVLKILRQSKPVAIGLLGSNYTEEGSFSAFEPPFFPDWNNFINILMECNIMLHRLEKRGVVIPKTIPSAIKTNSITMPSLDPFADENTFKWTNGVSGSP